VRGVPIRLGERDKRVSPFPQPAWEGGSLTGKTILVQAFHGFGDTIQFVRFLPLLKARGARVILEHQPALETLLQGAEGWDELVARHTGREVLERISTAISLLMSLPVPLKIEVIFRLRCLIFVLIRCVCSNGARGWRESRASRWVWYGPAALNSRG